MLESFRPFGIGNPKPKFYIEDLTIDRIDSIGNAKNHLSLSFVELPGVKSLLWNFADILKNKPEIGDIVSPIVSLSKNVWKEKESLQLIIETFMKIEAEE
jgi:single-stranded DNA-specific DHH superfamily exonuclease